MSIPTYLQIRTRFAIPTTNKFKLIEIENMVSDGHGGVDFNKLVPMPDDVAKTYDETYRSRLMRMIDAGADWRFEHWGCNWQGDNLHWEERDEDGCFLVFDTVDEPPLGWIKKFCETLHEKFGMSFVGEYVPDTFGVLKMGSFFITEDGEFVHLDFLEAEFHDPLREIQLVWGMDEQELIDYRGFLDAPSSDDSDDSDESDDAAETATVAPQSSVIVETPLERLKRLAIAFANVWVSRW